MGRRKSSKSSLDKPLFRGQMDDKISTQSGKMRESESVQSIRMQILDTSSVHELSEIKDTPSSKP